MKQLVSLVALLALTSPVVGQDKNNAAADGEITFTTGLTHLREGRVEAALEAFKKAVKQDPKSPYFQKGLGVAYQQYAQKCAPADSKCRQERYGEAVLAARKALELNPYYVDARNDLGTALLLLGKRDEGRKELLAAYEDPTNPTPELSARNLGQAYYDDKNYAQAESWYLTCVQRNKSYAGAYVGAADAMLAQNKTTEAIAQLELGEKEKIAGEDLNLALALGQAYYRAGRFQDARTRWEKVATKDPNGTLGRRAVELLRSLQQR